MTFPLKRVHFQGNYLNFFLGVKLSLCHDWRVWFKYIVHLRYIWHGQYYHGYTAYHPIVVLDLFFQAIALLSTPKAMQSYCEPNADWRQHMPNVVRKHRVKYEYCAPPACQGNPSWELCSPIKLEVYSPPTSNDEQQQIKVQRVLNPHPRKSPWNPKMEVWKMMFLFHWVIFRFHRVYSGMPCLLDLIIFFLELLKAFILCHLCIAGVTLVSKRSTTPLGGLDERQIFTNCLCTSYRKKNLQFKCISEKWESFWFNYMGYKGFNLYTSYEVIIDRCTSHFL